MAQNALAAVAVQAAAGMHVCVVLLGVVVQATSHVHVFVVLPCFSSEGAFFSKPEVMYRNISGWVLPRSGVTAQAMLWEGNGKNDS